MTRTIGRITRTAMLAVAFMLCATSAWAAADMINVNLYENTTYSAVSGLSPTSNMGYLSYAVQNTYWSDIAANNGSGTAKLYDSSIPGQLEDTVSVAVTGASGAYHPESGFDYTLLSGYIDDNATMTPTITLSSVPFDYYRVIVYFATDSYTRKYGHITLNDKLNIYGVYSSDLDEGYTDIGTNGNEGWGGCAPYQTVAGSKVVYMKEGRNVLISPVVTKTTDSSVKIESHALKTSDWVYRSCVAAVQVVKADTPATCTYTAPGTDTYNLFGAGNWDVEPASGSEAVTIAISGNTTLTVNDSRVFRSLTITGSGELTFAGTGTIITPSLTIDSGITLVKTAGNISSSATVSVPSGCTFEIASACTWSGVISGQGGVKVSANSVVFSSSNSFSGGLIVGEGGLVSTTQSTGFGTANSTITVQSGGSADIANTASAGYYYNIAGTGLNDIGALYSSGAMGSNAAQTRGITLSADATITVGANWGLIRSSFDPTALELGQYTLTKNGNGRFWMCNTTVSGAGKLLINSGYVVTVNSNKEVQGANAEIQVGSGGALFIGGDTSAPASGYSNLTIKKLTCDSGGTVSVASGRQLLIKNGGAMTVNGAATITGTLKLAEDTSAASTGTLTVGGTVTVNGTIDIPHRANIVRSGTGKVDIKSGGKVHYDYVFKNVNSKDYGWKSDYEGDVFTGAGTLEIRTNRISTHDATSSFSGIVKLYTASASNTGYINVLDGLTFTQRPEFITEGYYNLGNTSTLTVRDLSGSGVFLSNYSPSNLKYIDTKQTKPTTFSGTFKDDGGASNTRDVGLTVRGSEDGVYALTLTGDSTSRTALTIQDNGKVIFPSTGGSWSSGTVVVANGGYIEAQNTSALGTVDIQSGSVIVIPTVSEVPVALTGSTVTLPTSGTVTVDLSGVSVEEGGTVTVISASTLNNADASIFKQTSGNWLFLVDDNVIKAKKLGAINWSAGSWSDAPNFAAYRDATISASGTQSVTIPATTAFDTLTLSGSGTVCFSATGSETVSIKSLEIGAGVTLTANSVLDLTGCEITGDGTLDIPVGTTFAMDGVTCSAKVTVSGTLETSGTTTLSAANVFNDNGLVTVKSGSTELSVKATYLESDITICKGATLVFGTSWNSGSAIDHSYFYSTTSMSMDIKGTLDINSKRLKLYQGITLKLYEDAIITTAGHGEAQYHGDLDWAGNGNIYVYGDATIAARIRTENNVSPIVTVDNDATLSIEKEFVPQTALVNTDAGGGSLTKTGAGTLKFTQETLTKPITINEGKVQLRRAFTSGLAISIASGAELELGVGHGNTDINATGISFAGVTGTGTIRFSSSHTGYYTLPISAANMFATTLHVANDNTGKGLVIPWSGGVTTNRLLTAAGKYRTDWSGSSGVADRYFLALQDCDATWSGIFHENDRLHGMKVAGVESAEHKTLTLSGTQLQTNTLEVEPSGSVNLTGSWIGDTTVSGEFGGTGSITGALTLNAGSTFKVWETGSLTVSGALTLPGSGKVNVDVSAISLSNDGTTIMTFGSVSGTIAAFSCDHAVLEFDGTSLKAYPAVASITTTEGATSYKAFSTARLYAVLAGENLQYITIFTSDAIYAKTWGSTMRVRNVGGATITFDVTDEFAVPGVTVGGVTTYTVTNAPTEYTWTDAGFDSAIDPNTYAFIKTENHTWALAANWQYGDDSEATRFPQAGDTVVLNNGATVELTSNAACASMEVTGIVCISSESDVSVVVSGSVVLTADATQLTLTNVELDADAIETSAADKLIKWETSGGTTIYSVVDPAAEIVDGDQYGSLANAVEFAEAGDEITLLANASVGSVGKAITLDIDTYELTLTSADALDSITSLKGTGTLKIGANVPSPTLQNLLKNSNWEGTLEIDGLNEANNASGTDLRNYGNNGSTIRLKDTSLRYFTSFSYGGTLEIAGTVTIRDGSSGDTSTVTTLKGDGTLTTNGRARQMYKFSNADGFTGSLDIGYAADTNNGHTYSGRRIVFGTSQSGDAMSDRDTTPAIYVDNGYSAKLGDGKTWTAVMGININGTLEVAGAGTLASPVSLGNGATIKFDNIGTGESQKFLTVPNVAGSENTIKIAFNGATLRDAAKLIDWSAASYSSAPSVSFVFADGSDTLVDSGTTYLLSSEADGLYLRKAVAYTISIPIAMHYYPSVAVALQSDNWVYLCDAPNETVTLAHGKTIVTQGKDVSNLTVNSALDEYASPIPIVNESYSLANATSAPVTYYWTGATDSNWATIGNWKVNSSDGPVATRAMEATDSVAFTDGAIVALGATRTVAGIEVNGAVTITAKAATYKELKTSGDITGTGTLTFVDVCLSSMASGLIVAPNVNFTDDSELGGDDPFTFNGNVSISNRFPQWGCVSVIKGAVSVASGAEIQAAGGGLTIDGTTTFNGAFTKSGSNVLTLAGVSIPSTVTPTISNGSITINGAVTVSAGATFTIPASGLTVGDSASFVLGGKSSVLVDNGSGASGKVSTSMTDGAKVISTTSAGVTTYKVGYGTIFSVY